MPIRCVGRPQSNQKEALIRQMERVLERPLTPEEIRLILLAETIRDELKCKEAA